MKIIRVSNFDHDWVPDHLVCTDIPEKEGKIAVKALNKELSGETAPYFYQLVKDGHILKTVEY